MPGFFTSRSFIASTIAVITAALLVAVWDRHRTLIAAQGSPSCVAAPSGLVNWWPGDGNGIDIVDTANGSIINGATFAAGKVGQAFSFDGVDDYVQYGADCSVVADSCPGNFGTANFTVDFWIRTTSTRPEGVIGRRPSCTHGSFWDLRMFNGFLFLELDQNPFGDNYNGIGTNRPINDGIFHHVALVRQGVTASIYIDGVLAGANSSAGITNISHPGALVAGRSACTGSVFDPTQSFTGQLDEIEIFNRALTVSEIQSIFNAGSAGKCKPSFSCVTPPANLISWWPGDGNANDIKDSNNGALQNGAGFGAGLVGQAFSLDGSNDYVDLGNAPNLRVSSGDFTIDAWVRFNALSGTQSIVDKMSASGGSNVDGWRLIKAFDNRFWFCLGGGTGTGCHNFPGSTSTLFSRTHAVTGLWFHVAVVKTSTGFSLYINGQLEDSRSPLPNFLDSHSANLRIGSYVLEGAYLNGLVDEVEIHNRALSASEIRAIALAGSAGKCKNRPPVAVCQNVTVSAGPSCTTNASINNGSSDPDGDPITIAQSPAGPYPLGNTLVTLTVTDSNGASTQCVATVTVTNNPPTAIPGGPYIVNEGGSVVVTASGNDPEGGALSFAWDLDNNGSFETAGASAAFSASALTGPSSHTIRARVTDNCGLSTVASTVVNVLRVATIYLRGTGPNNNPPTLFLDTIAPTAATAKFKDSTAINFSGGNLWKEVGQWPATPSLIAGSLTGLSDLRLWLGLKNSDDQGTNFDLRVEVSRSGALVAAGETYCIQGVTRNPNLAKEVIVSFAPFSPVTFNGATDGLALKVLTRIGSDGAGGSCGGHSNAVGLRLYFDSVGRPSRFNATIAP